MEHEELRDKELSELEAALGRLLPRPSRLDRDRLLFLAGQASALSTAAPKQPGGRHRLWPAVSAVSTAAAVVLAVLLALRPGPQVVREIVYIERPAPSQPEAEEPRGDGDPMMEAFGPFDVADDDSTGAGPDVVTPSYLELRRRVFEVGLAALPEPTPASGGANQAPATQREMLREFLGDQEPAAAPARFFNWPFSIGDML